MRWAPSRAINGVTWGPYKWLKIKWVFYSVKSIFHMGWFNPGLVRIDEQRNCWDAPFSLQNDKQMVATRRVWKKISMNLLHSFSV